MLTLKYQGTKYDYDQDQRKFVYTWQSTNVSQIDSLMAQKAPLVGSYVDMGGGLSGYLTNIRKVQDQGYIWNCELEYKQQVKNGTITTPDSTGAYGAKSQELSVDTQEIDIRQHKNYHMRWDHYLIKIDNVDPPIANYDKVPQAWLNDKTGNITGWWKSFYMWATQDDIQQRLGQSPAAGQHYWVDPQTGTRYQATSDARWVICAGLIANHPEYGTGVCQPTKAGLQVYRFSYYTITESQKFNSAQSAGSFVSASLNTIVPAPPLGNMGITGGNWLVFGGSVSYDGKHWIARMEYRHDPGGWDPDVYTKQESNTQAWKRIKEV